MTLEQADKWILIGYCIICLGALIIIVTACIYENTTKETMLKRANDIESLLSKFEPNQS